MSTAHKQNSDKELAAPDSWHAKYTKAARRMAGRRAVLYHGTRYRESILKSNALVWISQHAPYISLTRSPRVAADWAGIYRDDGERHGAILVLNRASLENRYQLEPFDDLWGDNEREVRIYGADIVDLNDHLLGIIPIDEDDPPSLQPIEKLVQARAERMLQRFRHPPTPSPRTLACRRTSAANMTEAQNTTVCLRALIVTGAIAEGERLDFTSLSEKLRVTTGAALAALMRLEGEGVLDEDQGRYTVRQLSQRLQLELEEWGVPTIVQEPLPN
jgi:hypothetical protein